MNTGKALSRRTYGQRRGHVLVMAIFIAIFLYFLSVALVSQNRQNILLVLSEDHRLRASDSASAAQDLALHVMRHNPNWRDLLPERQGELTTGGKWEIQSIKYLSSAPHFLEATTHGNLGLFASTKKRVIEELAFDSATSSSAGSGCPTHLFAYAQGDDGLILAVLTPNMQWRFLGAPPNPRLSWLVAQEGPLFTQCLARDHQFSLEDVNEHGVMQATTITSTTQPLTFLRITSDATQWSDGKFPCHGFMSTPESTQESASFSPGSGSENLTKYNDAAVRNLIYDGPTLEWYTCTGGALAAHGNSVYSHALHHYYRGTQAKISSRGYSVLRSPRTYEAPAVLCYSASSNSWSVTMDMMSVSDRNSEPVITPTVAGNSADTDSLAYLDGSLYCISKSNSARILRLTPKEWQGCDSSAGVSLGLYGYNHKLLHHRLTTAENGDELVDFQNLPLTEGLKSQREALTLPSSGEGSEACEVYPKFSLQASALLTLKDQYTDFRYKGNNSTAICGRDVYTFVSVSASLATPSEALKTFYPDLFTSLVQRQAALQNSTIACLAHYDGEGWQIWPNGLNDLAVDWSGNATNSRPRFIVNEQGKRAKLFTRNLAAAHYDGLTQYHLNRYSVVYESKGDEP